MTTIFFGRCRIIHSGHLDLFEMCDHIYFSNSSRQVESAETARALGYTNVSYAQNIVEVLRSLGDHDQITLLVGEDRASMRSLENSFENLEVCVIPRDAAAPSSTRCREVIREGGCLIAEGLADSRRHASYMTEQYFLDPANN